ncbi:MAG: hypothetical protein ACLSDM_02425 [Butyricicoccus sp.]
MGAVRAQEAMLRAAKIESATAVRSCPVAAGASTPGVKCVPAC